MKILVAVEPDIEVTRHHLSMAYPLGEVHKWNPKQISAYDVLDMVKPDLVMCSHPLWHSDKGLSKYVREYNLNCLIRYEADGDVLGDNTITYTRYKNTQFKECLPACADVINYKSMDLKKKFDFISVKNYVGEDFLARKFTRENLKKVEKELGIKKFRGYNVKTEWDCGDLNDIDLCVEINKAECGLSWFHKNEVCVTSDVLNMLQCGIPVDVKCSDEQEYLLDDFDFSCMNGCKLIEELPKGHTNIDRAKKIRKLFNVK